MRANLVTISVVIASTGPVLADIPGPITDDMFTPISVHEAALGQLLFYDPILSGNKNIACASCHHPAFGTSDGVSLAIGEGGIGLGPDRHIDPNHPPEDRIPRNAPALFNLGALEFQTLFHDGRLERDPNQPGGVRTPLDADMVTGFVSVLSAQTMFPVLSRDEMAGGHRENEIGRAVRQGKITGTGGAWDLIARRVADVPEYRQRFIVSYPHISNSEDIAFTDISNAIAAFMAAEWRSDASPFDAHLRGEVLLQGAAADGMNLFYGKANCASCHSGPFLTDHDFHAMAAPQIGPGKAASFESHHRDDGRFLVTGKIEDRYKFRTPSLRNVALTAPYGHAGSHATLSEFVKSHADPRTGLARYDRSQAILSPLPGDDFSILNDPAEMTAISDAVTHEPVDLRAPEIAAIVAFLNSLTDATSVSGTLGVPKSLPSGLEVPNP